MATLILGLSGLIVVGTLGWIRFAPGLDEADRPLRAEIDPRRRNSR